MKIQDITQWLIRVCVIAFLFALVVSPLIGAVLNTALTRVTELFG
jgi:hypothetical protein